MRAIASILAAEVWARRFPAVSRRCYSPGMDFEGNDLDVLLRTGLQDPIAIALAKSLFDEAGIPYFTMDETKGAQRDVESFIGWWTVRVPRDREAEAREILRSVETPQ